MNEKGICPECESIVTMRPFGRLPFRELHSKYVAIIQRIGDDQILVRYFYVSYDFSKNDIFFMPKKERHVSERCREFLTGSGDRMRKESFEFTVYKQNGLMRWCPDTDSINCGMAVLYTKGLRETLAGTEYQYSGLEKFQEYEGCNPIPLWKYLDTYPGTKELETLVKVGLTTLFLTPKFLSNNLVKVVFPAPISPLSIIQSPFFKLSENFLASFSVSSMLLQIYFIFLLK